MKYNIIKKNPYIYSNLILKREHNRALEENINKLRQDLFYFIDKNKHSKRLRVKPINLHAQIKQIMDKLETSKEDHNKLLKSFQMNMNNKNKRFYNQKELDKFREKKRHLLNIMSEKMDMHKSIPNTNKNININNKNRHEQNKNLNMNNFNKTVFSFKRNNINLNENRTHDNKSSENIYFINNMHNKNKYKNKIKLESRNFKFKKGYNLYKPGSTQNRNILKLNFNDKPKLDLRKTIEDKEKIKLKESKKNISSISLDFKIDDNIDPDNMYNMKKKLYLEKLKSKVDNFENSNNFFPEDKKMYSNYIFPFTFLKRRNLSQFELDIFDKEDNKRFINKRKRMRKVNSLSKLKKNKTQTYFNRNRFMLTSKSKDKNKKNNAKIIIKKINIIKKRANKRKLGMKLLYKNRNKHLAKSLIEYFTYNEGKMVDENLENDIKEDALKYKNDLGSFTYVDGKFLFAGHLKQ